MFMLSWGLHYRIVRIVRRPYLQALPRTLSRHPILWGASWNVQARQYPISNWRTKLTAERAMQGPRTSNGCWDPCSMAA